MDIKIRIAWTLLESFHFSFEEELPKLQAAAIPIFLPQLVVK